MGFLSAPTTDPAGDAVADAVAGITAHGAAAMDEVTDIDGAALHAGETGRTTMRPEPGTTPWPTTRALDEGLILDREGPWRRRPGDGAVPRPAPPVADRVPGRAQRTEQVGSHRPRRRHGRGGTAAGGRRGRGRAWDATDAVTEIYAAHYNQLVRLALLLVHDVQTAEEVVQDAFEAMHLAWRRLREEEKALSYLRQTVVNRSRSVLRHRKVVDLHAPRPAPDEPSAEHSALALLRALGGRLGAAHAAGPAARGHRAALLRRPVRGGHRPGDGDQPGRGEEPHGPGDGLAQVGTRPGHAVTRRARQAGEP